MKYFIACLIYTVVLTMTCLLYVNKVRRIDARLGFLSAMNFMSSECEILTVQQCKSLMIREYLIQRAGENE